MTASAPQYQDLPRTGGRVELRLLHADTGATYGARWATPEGLWVGELRADVDGNVHATFEKDAAPTWLVEWSQQLLRTTARSRRAGDGPWPRRLTRWRAAPEER